MDYPENMRDELEAYPLRLNVAAMPDRRFFKMTRTLTIGVVLLSALLIALGVYLNYQLTHLDITVRSRGTWQFYRINPEDKKLQSVESVKVELNPLRLVIEEALREYILLRNSTVWSKEQMEERFGPKGLIQHMSSQEVLIPFSTESKTMQVQTREVGLIRDAHIYDLKVVNTNLWMALIETFDLPITDDLVSVCACSDNSKSCIQCKIKNAKKRERRKIWIRTGFNQPKQCRAEDGKKCLNPLGISVDKYISTFVPIHENENYWDLPPALQP